MEAVFLVLIDKLYSLLNVIIKGELLQTVQISNSQKVRKTITVRTCAPLRHSYARSRFSGLECPAQIYTTYLVPIKYFIIYYYVYDIGIGVNVSYPPH